MFFFLEEEKKKKKPDPTHQDNSCNHRWRHTRRPMRQMQVRAFRRPRIDDCVVQRRAFQVIISIQISVCVFSQSIHDSFFQLVPLR